MHYKNFPAIILAIFWGLCQLHGLVDQLEVHHHHAPEESQEGHHHHLLSEYLDTVRESHSSPCSDHTGSHSEEETAPSCCEQKVVVSYSLTHEPPKLKYLASQHWDLLAHEAPVFSATLLEVHDHNLTLHQKTRWRTQSLVAPNPPPLMRVLAGERNFHI